jgi:hypothetical protein
MKTGKKGSIGPPEVWQAGLGQGAVEGWKKRKMQYSNTLLKRSRDGAVTQRLMEAL